MKKLFLTIYNISKQAFLSLISKNNKKYKKGEKKMTHEFYDVKEKQKVVTEVIAKTTYGEGNRVRYAVKGKTKDGRNLTAFVSKENYEKINVK